MLPRHRRRSMLLWLAAGAVVHWVASTVAVAEDDWAVGSMAAGLKRGGTVAAAAMEVVGQSWLIVAVLAAGGVNAVQCGILAASAAHSATVFWHAAVTLPKSCTGLDKGLRTLAH
eukprot:590960-Prymnesium_polylepis.1